uniref:Uncharacterized protein n=1 Tax=Rhizophora mucronata TaxID=61149 RepID=A0A2P2QBA0_RHIMU
MILRILIAPLLRVKIVMCPVARVPRRIAGIWIRRKKCCPFSKFGLFLVFCLRVLIVTWGQEFKMRKQYPWENKAKIVYI